ncbi:MAG TPA: sulfatase [Candidatus Solibacter sp.]|nr:sulfatase [Candidatus Solibacter sp.]
MSTTRRTALKTLAAAPLLVRGADPAPPNILFVLSDDHSAPYLGCYGATWMSTPNLDQFAKEGVRFERAFTAAPQCVPSRTALMTGRSPVAARMGRFSSPLPADIVTVPEVLRTRNYYTGVCGRYFHLDGVVNPSPTTGQVYDKHQMRTWKKRVDFLDISSQAPTNRLFDQFLGQKPANRPWFFWINYNDPHHPWDDDAGHVDPAKIVLPAHLPDLPGVRNDLARYCGEIERADRFFGEAMSVLRKHGEESNTLVIFMGDNGMAFPHGKGSLYDPGLNVPLIARWPAHIKPGVSRDLISGEDVAATFMDAGGGELPKGASGRSFYPLLTGGRYQPRDYIFGARLHHGNDDFTPNTKASTFDLSRCVRSRRFKLIYNLTPQMEYWPVDSGSDPGWQDILAAHKAGKLSPEHERAYFQRPRPVIELYDLDTDPSELHNLAGTPEYRDEENTLKAALQEKLITDYDFVPPVIKEGLPARQNPGKKK